MPEQQYPNAKLKYHYQFTRYIACFSINLIGFLQRIQLDISVGVNSDSVNEFILFLLWMVLH